MVMQIDVEGGRPAPASKVRRVAVEWPTVAVSVAIYGGWLAATALWQVTSLWVAVPILAVLVAWHGSLQHEALHGHPTRIRWLNDAIASLPLSLWIPYLRYRALHLRHHRDPLLTDPLEDPESQYLTAARWAGLSRPRRWLVIVDRTLLGRLVLGPAIAWLAFWRDELQGLRAGERDRWIAWGLHLPGAALVGAWVILVAGMPLWSYLLVCYLGTSLVKIRSFAEHRAGPEGRRTAVVTSGTFFSLLFLNNNLHVAHHARPGLAWYRLPALARAIGAEAKAASGAGLWSGYGALARRHLLRPFDVPVHPDHRANHSADPR